MNTALHRLLLLLLLVLPWAAQAGDAADYAKASPAKQARLLESWAAAPAPERLPLIEALRANRVAIDQNKTPFIEENGAYRALEGDAEPVGTPKKLRLNNRLRGLLNTALASHQLFAEDPAQRLAAAKRLQRSGQPEQLELLQQRLDAEDDAAVSEALTLALANLQLTASDPQYASPRCACSAKPARPWPGCAWRTCWPTRRKPTPTCARPPRPAWLRSSASS